MVDKPQASFVYDRKHKTITKREIQGGNDSAIELLFPGWSPFNERVVFIGAHEDDAISGASILIHDLLQLYDAKIHLLVLTNGSQGFSPYKIINKYTGLFNIVKNNLNMHNITEEQLLDKMNEDSELSTKVAQLLQPYIATIRSNEMLKAGEILGMDLSNIKHYRHKGDTIDDRNIQPHRGLKLLDGEKGIDGWVIDILREIGATRVVAQIPSDKHPDHQVASEIAYYATQAAVGNMLHRGIPAPIKPYDMNKGILGLNYLIFERLPLNTGVIEEKIVKPRLTIEGNEHDGKIKLEAIRQFTSQRRLEETYKMMPGDGRFEHFEPMMPPEGRISPGLIDTESRYHITPDMVEAMDLVINTNGTKEKGR